MLLREKNTTTKHSKNKHMAMITVDPTPNDANMPVLIFIIAAVLITWLSIKAWRRKARERRLRWQQEDKFKA